MRICWRRLRPRPRRTEHIAALNCAACAAVVLGLLCGCATPPPAYVPVRRDNIRIVHCFDSVGHQPGSKPWIMGGTCCCTPTPELMQAYQRDGFCAGMTAEELIEMYHTRDIVLAIDHMWCNNLCQEGPHVTQGGRCMVPPTPGTRQFEGIVTGQGMVSLAQQTSGPGEEE